MTQSFLSFQATPSLWVPMHPHPYLLNPAARVSMHTRGSSVSTSNTIRQLPPAAAPAAAPSASPPAWRARRRAALATTRVEPSGLRAAAA